MEVSPNDIRLEAAGQPMGFQDCRLVVVDILHFTCYHCVLPRLAGYLLLVCKMFYQICPRPESNPQNWPNSWLSSWKLENDNTSNFIDHKLGRHIFVNTLWLSIENIQIMFFEINGVLFLLILTFAGGTFIKIILLCDWNSNWWDFLHE